MATLTGDNNAVSIGETSDGSDGVKPTMMTGHRVFIEGLSSKNSREVRTADWHAPDLHRSPRERSSVMQHGYPCGSVSRRRFLAASAATVPLISGASVLVASPRAAVFGRTTHQGEGSTSEQARGARPVSRTRRRGQESEDDPRPPRDREAIKATLDIGIKTLTGAERPRRGLEALLETGDVIGIKVVPNGQPYSHSSFEIVLEVIEKLKTCGVKAKDIFVYDRYRGEFMDAGYHKVLPRRRPMGRRHGRGRRPVPGRFPRIPVRSHRRIRSRCLRLDGPDPLRRQSQGRAEVPFASRQAGHQDAEQDRGHSGVEGPRLGRCNRGAQEHESRHGQQRQPLAQQPRSPTSATSSSRKSPATRSSATNASSRSWTASKAC